MDKTGRWKHRKVDSTETGLQLCAVYLQQSLTEAFFWLSVTRSVWTVWCRQRGSPGQIYSPNHFQSLHIPVQAAKNAWDIFSIKLFNLTEINLRSILQEKLFFLNGLFSPSPLSLGQNKVYDITCEPSLWFRPIHLSKCSEIPVRWFFLCSHLDWALLKMKRVPQSQSPKMSNAARGKEFVCGRWLTGLFRLPESCHVQQCK